MADDKPMTVKERMAALARASSGGGSTAGAMDIQLADDTIDDTVAN